MTLRLPSLLLLFISLLSIPLLSAQNLAVHLVGRAMRAPLDVPIGKSTIQLCDLTPGQTYLVTAVAMAQNQTSTFEIVHSKNQGGQTDRKDDFRFTANSECVEIDVQATDLQKVASIPMYLSVYCESCAKEQNWKNKLKDAGVSVLEVTGGMTAADLINNTLIGSSCYNISNVTYSGQSGQIGTFSNGTGSIGFDEGIMLTTGEISVAPGPNDMNNSSAGYGIGTPDPDLSSLTPGSIVDRADIEFDFTPTTSQVSFEYVFASEEYCEFVNSNFNDVFGFFISGPGITGTKNLAVIGTNTPVSVNTVNHLTNSGLYTHNTPPSGVNCFITPANGPAVNELQYDGFTKKLTATATVIPCQTYHIKLKIADVSDGLYDSGVFLRANSFSAGGSVAAEPVYPEGQSFSYENCDSTGYIRFVRSNGNTTAPLPVTFSISPASTATVGVDYAPLVSPVVIPAGQNEILLPVTVFGDQITEGDENIVLLINNSCSCTQSQLTYAIKDNLPLTIELANQVICSGSTTTLSPNVISGAAPFHYLWNNGAMSESIVVHPTISKLYIVSVVDACGHVAIDTALVQVLPAIQTTHFYPFCIGDSVVLNGVTYTSADTIVQVIPGLNGGCDTILTSILQALPQITTTDTIRFCAGTSVTLGGVVYSQSGVVQDTLLGQNGNCDTLATYVLQLLQQFVITDTITFCQGDSIHLNGGIYTTSGVVMDTLPGINGGCDTLATYILQATPKPVINAAINLCAGDSITIGGSVYTQSATVTATLPSLSGGCDTLATYTLEFAPTPTLTYNLEFCSGDSVVVNGTAYTHPDTVLVVIPAATGCDTLATYILKYITPSGPTSVKMNCPANVSVTADPSAPTMPVTYSLPAASTDCLCPGLNLSLQQGLVSGSNFPTGTTKICYTGKDSCGNSATCCFNVSVVENSPCDIKVISCIKYELLSVTEDAQKRKTYRIRTTNNCEPRMVYMAIQLPNGLVADLPHDNTIYTAPGGHTYLVRNPNFSPFYSVRYLSVSDSIQNGESDVFKYTLPPQISPNYIHLIARLENGTSYEAHLNTFYCEIGYDPDPSSGRPTDRDAHSQNTASNFSLFPNPTDGTLYANLSNWANQQVQLRVYTAQGRLIQTKQIMAENQSQQIDLPADLSNGLYLLEVRPAKGSSQTLKFTVMH